MTKGHGGPEQSAKAGMLETTDPLYPDERSEVLTVPELCRLLRMSKNTVYEGLKTGKIPGEIRVGRAVRVHRDTVLSWMAKAASDAAEQS